MAYNDTSKIVSSNDDVFRLRIVSFLSFKQVIGLTAKMTEQASHLNYR
jgi:hypothetical protein